MPAGLHGCTDHCHACARVRQGKWHHYHHRTARFARWLVFYHYYYYLCPHFVRACTCVWTFFWSNSTDPRPRVHSFLSSVCSSFAPDVVGGPLPSAGWVPPSPLLCLPFVHLRCWCWPFYKRCMMTHIHTYNYITIYSYMYRLAARVPRARHSVLPSFPSRFGRVLNASATCLRFSSIVSLSAFPISWPRCARPRSR